MVKINFHMHSTGSDGNQTPEEVVKEAINQGISFICLTDHYRRPQGIDVYWDTSKFHSKEYVSEIRRLQKTYKNQIDISYGGEFDWLPNHMDWMKAEIAKEKYDFVIGSVHLLFKDKKDYYFMFGKDEGYKWKDSSEKFGGIKNFVLAYYKEMQDMIKSGIYDSVGHFDVIKIHNDNKFFSEKEEWYTEAVLKTLDILKKSKMAMEINTGGLGRDIKDTYPSLWILKEAKKRNIPLTIGTDSHHKDQIGKHLHIAYDLAKEAGYNEIVRFKDRKMISISI